MKIYFTAHCIQRIHERSINKQNVIKAVTDGEIINEYPDDKPYPSRLSLHTIDEKPLHVVYSVPHGDSGIDIIVITVYEPTPEEWENDYRKRRTPK